MKYSFFLLILLTHLTCIPFDFINNKTQGGALCDAFFKQIIAEFNPDVFIETGTYDGKTAETAAKYFKQVHTVELHPELYRKAKIELVSKKNVTVYCDSSPEMIKKVAPTVGGNILFWLDAHYSGENTAMSNDNPYDPQAITPICQELQAIKESNIQNCTILIDDIRGFGTIIDGTEFLGCWAYPSLQEICDLGMQINPNFSFALLGDTLLMYDSAKFSPNFSPVVTACTASRLYNGSNLTDLELIDHEKVIMHAKGAERDFIKDLYQRMTNYKDPLFHHDLWYGLVSMGSKDWKEALVALQKVPNRLEYFNKKRQKTSKHLPYNHWRIAYYVSEVEKNLIQKH